MSLFVQVCYLKWELVHSVCLQQGLEFVELYLSRSVLVNFFDKFLNVDGHLELVLNRAYQLLCVDAALAVWLAAHSNESLEHLCFVGSAQSLHFFFDHNIPKCIGLDLTSLLGIDL